MCWTTSGKTIIIHLRLFWPFLLLTLFQDVKVEKQIIHPDYKTTRSGIAVNDIMLIKLEKPVEYNDFVSPICLPDRYLEQS